MDLKQFMVRNQCGYFNKYLVFIVNRLDIDDVAEDDDDSEKPSTTSLNQNEGKLFLPKLVYLKSNLRRIDEYTPTLYLRRTEETYKFPIEKNDVPDQDELVQESIAETTDEDLPPPLNWIPSNEIGQVFAVEEEFDEVEELIAKKTKRISIIDSIFPVRETAAKEDLEILRRFEGVRFILDEDFKQFTDEEDLSETKEEEEKDGELDVKDEEVDIQDEMMQGEKDIPAKDDTEHDKELERNLQAIVSSKKYEKQDEGIGTQDEEYKEPDTEVKPVKSIEEFKKDGHKVDVEKGLMKQEEEIEKVPREDEAVTMEKQIIQVQPVEKTTTDVEEKIKPLKEKEAISIEVISKDEAIILQEDTTTEDDIAKSIRVTEEPIETAAEYKKEQRVQDDNEKELNVYEPKKIIDEIVLVTEEKIEVRADDGQKMKKVKKTVKKTGKSTPRKISKDSRLNKGLAITDEETLDAIKQIASPVMSSLLTDVFECVVEEQIYSIYKDYSEAQDIVTDVINSLLNRMIQDVTLKKMQQECICRQKRELALKEKQTKRVCKCKRKRIVTSQAFVSRCKTIDKAVQNVVYEIYNSVPNKKYLELQEVHLDNCLVNSQLLKMEDLIYLDIELSSRRRVTIPPQFYQLGQNTIKIKSTAVDQSFSSLKNLSRRPLPAISNVQESNENETVNTKMKTPAMLIMKTNGFQEIYEILHAPSNSHELNIVVNTTGIDVKIKPTSRRVILIHGKQTSRLT